MATEDVKNDVCGRPAVFAIVWGAKRIYQCAEHARGIIAVGQAMGYTPIIDAYSGPETCSQHLSQEEIEMREVTP